jgi:hypothetical protein
MLDSAKHFIKSFDALNDSIRSSSAGNRTHLVAPWSCFTDCGTQWMMDNYCSHFLSRNIGPCGFEICKIENAIDRSIQRRCFPEIAQLTDHCRSTFLTGQIIFSDIQLYYLTTDSREQRIISNVLLIKDWQRYSSTWIIFTRWK